MEEHTRSVVKFGGGHAVILPAKWVRDLNISKGDRVYMRATQDGELVIRPPVEWEEMCENTEHSTTNYICLGGGETVKEISKSVVKFGDGYLVVLPNSWVQYFEISGDDKILMGANNHMELMIKVPDLKKQYNVEMERMRQEEIRQELINGGGINLRIELDKPMIVQRTYAKYWIERDRGRVCNEPTI